MLAMAVGRATLYKQFDNALLVAIGFYGIFAYSTRHITPLVNAAERAVSRRSTRCPATRWRWPGGHSAWRSRW